MGGTSTEKYSGKKTAKTEMGLSMEKQFIEEERYHRAQKRVEEILEKEKKQKWE